MDTFITLLVFAAIAGISALLRKRQEKEAREEQQREEQGAPGAPVPPRRPAASWEEQMRRLLTGEEPAPPHPAPPPIPSRPPGPEPGRLPSPTPPIIPMPKSVPQTRRNVMEEARALQTSLLAQAEETYRRTAEMARQTPDRLRQPIRRPVTPPAVGKLRFTEAELAVNLLRDRISIRAVVLASVILGPPKAFGE